MSLTAENLFEQIRQLSRAEYHRMAETGLFEDERVELLEGVIYRLAPQKSDHAISVRKITNLLLPALLGRAVCQVQLPLALGNSEPEPDFAVLFEASADELSRTDHPDRARLVIEVSETTLAKDREIKQRIYAAAGVPEYWILNLPERTLEVYRLPAGDAYRSRIILGEADPVSPEAFQDLTLRPADLLPGA